MTWIVPGRSTAERILALYKEHESLTSRTHESLTDQERFEKAEDIRREIWEEPLTVRVRPGWHEPGGIPDEWEYEILLCTGGPAIRIIGDLDEHKEPCTAVLQGQDWFKPWTDTGTSQEETDALLWYAQQHYYGD